MALSWQSDHSNIEQEMDSNTPAVLIVDDEVDACRNMADILTDFGYQVDTAYDGFSALDLIRSRTYDIALLDLRMPGMDGLTLYRNIKELSAGTAAIIVTAFAAKTTANEALVEGVVKVLPKPVDFANLMKLLELTLERPLLLLVDDDVELCKSLWDVLNQHGYRVFLAHDEDEATVRLSTQEYHAVLIDMKLPQGDGRGVLRKVRQASPETPVIAITGCIPETEEIVQHFVADGGNAVCYKPFDIPKLLSTLDDLVESRKSP